MEHEPLIPVMISARVATPQVLSLSPLPLLPHQPRTQQAKSSDDGHDREGVQVPQAPVMISFLLKVMKRVLLAVVDSS